MNTESKIGYLVTKVYKNGKVIILEGRIGSTCVETEHGRYYDTHKWKLTKREAMQDALEQAEMTKKRATTALENATRKVGALKTALSKD